MFRRAGTVRATCCEKAGGRWRPWDRRAPPIRNAERETAQSPNAGLRRPVPVLSVGSMHDGVGNQDAVERAAVGAEKMQARPVEADPSPVAYPDRADAKGIILLIAGASAPTSHALSYRVGQEVPVHAGGGSKVLLAYLAREERRQLLSKPLERYTANTITDPAVLEAELAQIRAQGWAHDAGEFSERVKSYAAPIWNRAGDVVAAISVAFAANDNQAFHRHVLDSVLRAAQEARNVLLKADHQWPS